MNKILKDVYTKYKKLIESGSKDKFLGESLLIDFTQDELDILISHLTNEEDDSSSDDLADLTAIIIRRDYNGPVSEEEATYIINRIVMDLTVAGMVKRGILSIDEIDKFTGEWSVKLTELGEQFKNGGVIN